MRIQEVERLHRLKAPLKTKFEEKLGFLEVPLIQTVNGEQQKRPFTTNDLQLFNKFYDIKKDERYCYHYIIGNRYGYSQLFCDFIIEEIERNPETFVGNLKMKTKKEDNPRHM